MEGEGRPDLSGFKKTDTVILKGEPIELKKKPATVENITGELAEAFGDTIDGDHIATLINTLISLHLKQNTEKDNPSGVSEK